MSEQCRFSGLNDRLLDLQSNTELTITALYIKCALFTSAVTLTV